MSLTKLNPLAFGNNAATVSPSINALYDATAALASGNLDISATGQGRFLQRSSTIEIGTARLVAASSTPLLVRRDESQELVLRFANTESSVLKVGKLNLTDRAGRTAVLFSGAAREGLSNHGYSSVSIKLDRKMLIRSAASMLGPDLSPAVEQLLCLHHDREISLSYGNVNFDEIFRKYFSLVESTAATPSLVQLLGLEEMLYRSLASLLLPEYVLATTADERRLENRGGNNVLPSLCEILKARIDESWCLSDIERVSGLSCRTLQYAFQRKFGCTPMQWLRDERLQLARMRLTHADDSTSIASIAYQCGFTHLGLFARYYKARFSELPSETIARANGGRYAKLASENFATPYTKQNSY